MLLLIKAIHWILNIIPSHQMHPLCVCNKKKLTLCALCFKNGVPRVKQEREKINTF